MTRTPNHTNHHYLSSGKRGWIRGPVLLIICTGLYLGLSSASLANNESLEMATREIRGHLENQFKEVTGLGFREFHCDYPDTWPTSREFTCFATDDESDHFIYRIILGEGQEGPLISMMQPASQLNTSGLATISRPVEAFLIAFVAEDWDGALASLSPELRDKLGLEGLRDILAPLRARLGNVSNPEVRFYASPQEGLHQLEYTLDSAQGGVVGRFRLRIDSENNPQVIAFLVTSEPGGPLQAILLEETGKAALGQFFDQPIRRIDGPLDSLRYIGDNVNLDVTLQDGSTVKARIEQHGSSFDVDGNDYRFNVLDARTLIGLYLASSDRPVKVIDCPGSVAPDGGHVDCMVTFTDDSRKEFRLLRRGGEHRLVEAE